MFALILKAFAPLAVMAPLAACSALSATGDMAMNIAQAGGKVFALASVSGPENAEGETSDTSGETRSSRIALNTDDPGLTEFDKLQYRGGLRIDAEDDRFGGLSGLIISKDGKRFLSVSDKGYWVRGELTHKSGELIGASNVEIKRMRGLDGKKLKKKDFSDAEALVGDMDGVVFVSFEHKHRIWSYDLSTQDGLKVAAEKVATPEGIKRLKSNSGLEGITLLQDRPGSMLILSEDTKDMNANTVGWVLRPGGHFRVALKPIPPFKLTDLATLPNGDILTLERRFSPAGGPGYLLRRIEGSAIQPDGVLIGKVLASAGMPFAVDNMEGLDYRIDDHGNVIIYIISDDNYNPLQRTLLLSFRLMP